MNKTNGEKEGTLKSQIKKLIEKNITKGSSKPTIMSASCSGGGGGTTTNVPGCSSDK